MSASAGPALAAANQSSASSDKYAALAELDSVFSSTATSTNAYTSPSNVNRYMLDVADFLHCLQQYEFRGITETASFV